MLNPIYLSRILNYLKLLKIKRTSILHIFKIKAFSEAMENRSVMKDHLHALKSLHVTTVHMPLVRAMQHFLREVMHKRIPQQLKKELKPAFPVLRREMLCGDWNNAPNEKRIYANVPSCTSWLTAAGNYTKTHSQYTRRVVATNNLREPKVSSPAAAGDCSAKFTILRALKI